MFKHSENYYTFHICMRMRMVLFDFVIDKNFVWQTCHGLMVILLLSAVLYEK